MLGKFSFKEEIILTLFYDLVVMSFRRKLFDNEKGNLIMIAAVIIIKA